MTTKPKLVPRFLNNIFLALIFSLPYSAIAQAISPSSEKTPKDQYLAEKSLAIRNAQTCQQLANQFYQQELDRFSSNGSRVFGVDLHGKIFEVQRSSNGVCRINTIAKLGIPYQERGITGAVEE